MDFDVTAGAFQTTFGGTSDAFYAVIDPGVASSLVYATYLGGIDTELADDVALDASDTAYITGYTQSNDFNVTGDAHDSTLGGTRDAFLVNISPVSSGINDLIYSTYIGGTTANDQGYSVAVADNQVYVVGETESSDFSVTGSAYDSLLGGTTDAFVTRFYSADLVVDTVLDVIDGNTTSIAALLADKGTDGYISLREAIIAANNTANIGGNPDEIHFQITGALVNGTHTIQVGNAADGSNGILPAITDPIIIDGTTDADFAGTPVIELDGQFATASDPNGLTLETSGSTIRGLIINRFGDDAIEIDNHGGGHTIVGNYLGTDATGLLSGYGNQYGITVKSDGNTIGGTNTADRNVIAGNSTSGQSYGIGFWQDADK